MSVSSAELSALANDIANLRDGPLDEMRERTRVLAASVWARAEAAQASEPEPGPHDERRLAIEVEADVNLAAVSAARTDHPSPHDIVTYIDRAVVAAVEALPGLSAVISRRISMTDPRFGRGRA